MSSIYTTDKVKCFIGDLNKEELLRALWDNSHPAAFFIGRIPPSYNSDLAKEEIDKSASFDYFCGRCIKADLSGDFANVWAYDRDIGDGEFERVCNVLREKSKLKF
jgi:hypothetical protein